jgi:D-threo-aldose 1-dehydrogenase
MPRRRLGRTALEIGVMGLGCAPIGGLYRASSMVEALATVRAAAAGGINHFDVAPQYGRGLAEGRLGAALAALSGADTVLSTKVGRLLEPLSDAPELPNWPEALPYSEVYDVTPEGIRRSLRDSQQRLGRDRIDLLLLHDPDRYASGEGLRELIAEAQRTMTLLRDSGAVSAIGLGVNAPEPCRMALELGGWDCFLLAGTYSVIAQDDAGLLARCAREGVSVLVGGPYMSGALAGGTTWRYRPIPPEIDARIAALRQICADHEVDVEAAALQFPLRHPAVASVVVGMRNGDEVRQNLAFLQRDIPPEFWSALCQAGLAEVAA